VFVHSVIENIYIRGTVDGCLMQLRGSVQVCLFRARVTVGLRALGRVEAVFPGWRWASSFLCQEICVSGRFCCSCSEVMLDFVCVIPLAPF